MRELTDLLPRHARYGAQPNGDNAMLERRERPLLSALDLARRVEAGELTPEGIVDLCAAAIAAREDEVGAFTYLDIEGARANARKNAEQLRTSTLRGLTVGLKDIYDTHDMP